MLADTFGTLFAAVAFAAVLYAPGYLLGSATNLFNFRSLRLTTRSLWAVALSFCVAPILAYLVGRTAGLNSLVWLFGLAFLATLSLFASSRSRGEVTWRELRAPAILAAAWAVAVLVLLVDFGTGHKLYFSVVMADGSYRIAFTDAVLRTGIPPSNPLYFGGAAAPMRYYYFWYVLCAVVARLAHVSARPAFYASSIWAGYGLLATVWLFGIQFFRWQRRQRWLACGLLLVSGIDILPAVGQALLQPALNGDTEWWSVDPIDSWPDSLLWVPHHVASVLCCLLGFLLLWRTLDPPTPKDRRLATGFAGLAFASALGLSVYVAFGFALLTVSWFVWLFVRKDPRRLVLLRHSVLATLLSTLLLVPFLGELAVGLAAPGPPNPAQAPGTHLFSLSVRRMIDSELITTLPVFSVWHTTHPILLDTATRLLLLLPGLAMELGVYGLVLIWFLRNRQRSATHIPNHDARSHALFFAVCGLVLTMFLSSAVITNNDFGYRAVMLPQFFLVLLAADLFGSWWLPGVAPVLPATSARRRLTVALVSLSLLGLLYWAVLLRAWLPLETAHPQNGFSHLAEDNHAIRQAFQALNQAAPAAAVVAFRPIDPTPDRQGEVMVPNEYYQRMLVMDTGRQMLNAEGKCATQFGGNPAPCPSIQAATAALYRIPVPSAAQARAFCRQFGVSYLVLSAWDPSWHAVSGWPLELPAAQVAPRFKLFGCQ